MAFHFSLDSVLRIRRSQERAELLKLEAITSEQRLVRARLEDVSDRSLESRRRFQKELAGGLHGSELRFQATREANTGSLQKSLQEYLLQLERNRQAQIQVSHEFRQRREILENLRLRKLNLYDLEQSRHEQRELDDLFLMRQQLMLDEPD